jgi:hypothetical protein
LCQVITTFSTGINALNGLTAQVQYLATGTSGTDFNISSVTATHTFNIPSASATNRGLLTSSDWTAFNSKGNGTVTSVNATVPSIFSVSGVPITGSGTIAMTYSGTALPAANGGTGLTSPGASGNVLTSNGTSWASVAPVTPISAINLNLNTITSNQTINTGTNGLSVGPMTLTNGATVTVTNGQTYIIL